MGFLMMPILAFNGSKPEVSIHSTLHFRQLSVDTQKAQFLSIQPGMDSGKALSKITRQILMLAVLDGLIIHQDDS
ncbi:phage tail protein [Klebsiella pneumoniae]|nr:phage tail protein [Klebsiella pneumoniae]